jgi:hypothetical protein
LVYCDRCGAKANRHDNYCASCGNAINAPPLLWRIRQSEESVRSPSSSQAAWVGRVSARKAVELETRRLVPKSIEQESATDRTNHPRFSSHATQSGDSLVQVEQTHPKEQQTPHQNPEQLLAEMALKDLRQAHPPQARRTRKRSTMLICYTMLLTGTLSLVVSIIASSTVLAFIGLGILFWGALLLFIKPQHYVRSDLMDSTALSSLKTIDRVMTDLGYYEKGIYIPGGNPERVVVFVPAEPFGRVPTISEVEGQTFIEDPKGIAMIPPGIALANMIEKHLDIDLTKCSLETLRERLPKLLVEDLEIAQDFEMQANGAEVRLRFSESIYYDFCHEIRDSTRVCAGLGCPMCSAMACVLAISTGKPVSLEGDKYSADGKTIESTYHILEA